MTEQSVNFKRGEFSHRCWADDGGSSTTASIGGSCNNFAESAVGLCGKHLEMMRINAG